MYRSILVPLDGSTSAEHALPLALSIARRSSATLRLVHVLPPLASVYSEPPLFMEGEVDLVALIKRRLRDYLDALAGRMTKLSGMAIKTDLLDGQVTSTLQAYALETTPDLVVMTTHGRGPLARFWLGSVADGLVRVLAMPVLLVRPTDTVPDLDVEPHLKNILVPLDGSKLAEQMLDRAIELGQLAGAGYTLLRVLKPIPLIDYWTGSASLNLEVQGMLRQIDEVQQREHEEALAYLESVAARLRQQGLRVDTKLAVAERPGVAIVQAAVPPVVDLVALATHGRRGLSRLLLGSVADKVIRGAAVPVLVHRPLRANSSINPGQATAAARAPER